MLRLYAIGEPTRSILERHAAHKAAEPVRPVGIRQERAEYWPAEELPVRSDLRGDCAFAQPTVVGPGEVGVIEAAVAGKRDMFGEEDLRSHAKRRPLHPVMLRIAVFGPLVNED